MPFLGKSFQCHVFFAPFAVRNGFPPNHHHWHIQGYYFGGHAQKGVPEVFPGGFIFYLNYDSLASHFLVQYFVFEEIALLFPVNKCPGRNATERKS